MSRKNTKKTKSPEIDVTEVDERSLLDPNYFYWAFIRPAEDAADKRKEKRENTRSKQQTRSTELATQRDLSVALEPAEALTEDALLTVIENIIRSTHHAYGYCHLGELGQQLGQNYPALQWTDYGCKKLINFLQKYPALFKKKWSAPSHHGASHVWVRIAYEPKLKEGYTSHQE